MMLMIVGVGIASVTQIFQFFNKNFFSESGHLMLTLPVGRFGLLISKVLISIIWFNFMLAVAAVSISLMWNTAVAATPHRTNIFDGVGAMELQMLMEANVLAFFAITLLFFCMAFARSTFMGKRVHGVVAGVVGLVYGWLYFWAHMAMGRRSMEMVTNEFVTYDGRVAIWNTYMPKVGLQYGRISLYEFDTGAVMYLDIFQIGLVLVMGIAAIVATYYPLKRRVSLK
jgi:hypothetical protein